MQVSRRGFFRISTTAATGTALGGLTGLGANLAPAIARAQELRIKNAKTIPSICPYCAVGCATLVHTVDDKIVNIEGDPRSPFSEGMLCPKGAVDPRPIRHRVSRWPRPLRAQPRAKGTPSPRRRRCKSCRSRSTS